MKRSKLKGYRLFYEKVPAKIPLVKKATPKRQRLQLPINILENLDNSP